MSPLEREWLRLLLTPTVEALMEFTPAAEQRGNNLEGFTDFYLKNDSSQGHNLALAVLFVPSSLESGMRSE